MISTPKSTIFHILLREWARFRDYVVREGVFAVGRRKVLPRPEPRSSCEAHAGREEADPRHDGRAGPWGDQHHLHHLLYGPSLPWTADRFVPTGHGRAPALLCGRRTGHGHRQLPLRVDRGPQRGAHRHPELHLHADSGLRCGTRQSGYRPCHAPRVHGPDDPLDRADLFPHGLVQTGHADPLHPFPAHRRVLHQRRHTTGRDLLHGDGRYVRHARSGARGRSGIERALGAWRGLRA
jgi:hypothetical protein